MTTTIVFGNTNDAHLASTSTAYATALAGSGSLSVVTGGGLTIGQNKSGSNFIIYQAFLEFAYTKPSNSKVVSAYLRLLSSSVAGTGVTRQLEFQEFDWGGTVNSADWRPSSTLRSLMTSNQNAWALLGIASLGLESAVANVQNANAGLAVRGGIQYLPHMDATATKRYVVYNSRNRLEQTPTAAEYNAVYAADSSGTANDPALFVATSADHLLDRCMGSMVQLSDGTYVYEVMDSTTQGTDTTKVYHRTSAGVVTLIYSSPDLHVGGLEAYRGAQSNTMVRDESDNIYLLAQGSSDGYLNIRPLFKGSGYTWTAGSAVQEATPGYDGTINNVAAAWHPQGGTRGTIVVLIGRVAGLAIQANQVSYCFVNVDRLHTGSGSVFRASGNADGVLIRSTSIDGFNNFVNETGSLVDICQAATGSAKGHIQSVARHHVLGSTNGPVLAVYQLNASGTGMSYATAEETVSGFCTKDADAKLRTVPITETQFVTVTASPTTGYGLNVKHRQSNLGSANTFNTLADVRLDAAALATMPSPTTLATSPAWDVVHNPADNKLWLYYFDVGNGRRLMRTDIDLNTGLAGHTEYEVNATVGATGSTNLAIRVHRGRTISDRVLVQVANRTSGGTHSVILVDDPINAAPTQPTLTPKANFDATNDALFEWTFNDPNIASGDAQTARRLIIDNATTELSAYDTGKVTTALTNLTLPASSLSNEQDWRWRVMTWDSEDEPSPWSDYDFFTTSAKGVVNITDPAIDNDPNVITANYTVVWNVTGTIQTAYKVVVTRNDSGATLIDTGWVTSTSTSYLIVGMSGDVEYQVAVTVRNAALIESNTALRLITPDYNSPEVPTVSFDVQDDLGYVGVNITNPTPVGDRPNPTHNEVHRRIHSSTTPNAAFEIIGEAEPNGLFKDYTAASGVSYDYRIRAIAGEFFEDSTITQLETPLELQGVWLHDPVDAETTVRQFVHGKDQRSSSTNTLGTTQQYAGRRFPVVEFGEHQEDDFSISVDVPHGPDYRTELDDLLAFMEMKVTLVLRDNRGRSAYGTMSGYSVSDQAWGSTAGFKFSRVSYDLEEV